MFLVSRPVYEPMIVDASAPVLQYCVPDSATELTYSRGIATISFGGRNAGTLKIPLLTFNAIILLTLAFASAQRPFAMFAVRICGAILLLVLVHLAAVVTGAKAMITLTRLHALDVAATPSETAWVLAHNGYTFVGAYALAFAIWYMLWGVNARRI